MWKVFAIWGRKFNQNQFNELERRRSISYKFEKHFPFNLPYPTAKSFSNQLAKTFSHLQMDIFCHFNISQNRKIAFAHSIFFARFRRRKGKKFRKNGRLSSMGLLAFLFTIFMQCIDCHYGFFHQVVQTRLKNFSYWAFWCMYIVHYKRGIPKNVDNAKVQVNLCQKLFFLQNMRRTCCVQKLFWMSETISVHNMFCPGLSLEFSCIELVIQWTICHHIVG